VKYTHVRFAYYDTYTTDQYRPKILLKQAQDLEVEARVRARHFIDVARYVADQIAKNPVAVNGRVLTIFLAPEFYLRSSVGEELGPNHYGQAQVAVARRLIRDLVILDDRFDDWLLVPGTAVTSTYFGYKRAFWLLLSDAYCIARVPMPGGTQIEQWHCIKQTFASEDKLHQDLNASMVDSGVVNQQIMSLNGVDIGLEICLDHREKALQNTVLLSNPPRNIDVQLLVSCAMDLMPNNVATRSHGLCLRCDGSNYQPPPGKEYRIGNWPGGRPARGAKPGANDLTTKHQRFGLPPNLQIRPNPTVPDTAGYFAPESLTPPPPPP
jgi:hypothetical protein